ncbi:hypothetical protein EYW49_22740 [Siculibacillus lacustris]|uniref:Uncharacterized protein n=1 Tax=Siculibacillus lacustris TaxID=1549641 RepID=A0A4Q9VBV7_9HYPH|nr:hypothetical protein EYW49_22740 [Siculibacillus lacustris]
MSRITLFAASVILALQTSAVAQTMSVQSLLAQGYTIAGILPSPAGPGIFLQKETNLVVCFVTETPTSTEVATRYCKPVR